MTGADGRVLVTGFPAGAEFYADLYDLMFANPLGSGVITVVADTTTTLTIPITTPASGSISVDVSGAGGAPFAGADVHLFNSFNECDPVEFTFCAGVLQEPTNAGGNVTFDVVPAGEVRIVVIANGVIVFDDVVTVTEGAQTNVAASALLGALDVTVTAGGQPAAGLNAVVTHSAGTATVMTDAAGVAHFPFLPLGSLDIEIQTQLATPLANGTATITAGATAQRAFVVTIPAPQPPKSTVSAGTASVVQNPETGQFTTSMANGNRQDVTLEFEATCASGSTPSAVTVYYGADSYTPTIVGSGPGYTVTIPAASLGAGGFVTVEATCDGNPELDDLGRIVLYDPSGLVTDAVSGDPVVGAEVYLYRVPGWSPRASSADDATPMTCQTNESKAPGAPWSQPAPTGEGVLEPANSVRIDPQLNPYVTDGIGYYGWDVAEGCWYITIDAPGYEPYVSPVVGVPSEVTDLDVELDPIPTVPGVPTGVSAVVSSSSDTSVVVAWSAPVSDGNSAITGYSVSTSPASAGCSTAGALTCTIAGLSPDTTYTVRVVATNAVGSSAQSAGADVTTPPVVVPPTVPGVPTGVSAVVSSSSDTSVVVAWSAPVSDGNSAITGYSVSTSPASAGCSTAGALTCTIAGLSPDTTYTVRVVATNAVGSSAQSAGADVTTPPVVVPPTDGPDLIGVSPARLLETRADAAEPTVDGESFGGGAVGSGAFVEVQIAGRGGVPDGASAAMLNLTTVRPTGKGFATLYPCGDVPNASSLNFVAGSNVANATFVQLSDEGTVCVFTSRETHLVLDVVGFAPEDSEVGSVSPARLLETRADAAEPTVDGESFGGGAVGSGAFVEVQIAGRGGVPDGASAAMLNLTTVRPTGKGFATLYPCGDVPNASSLNFVAGSNVANATFVQLSDEGTVCVFTSRETHLVLDVVGFAPEDSEVGSVSPARLLETRADAAEPTVDGESFGGGAVGSGAFVEVQIAGRGGVPDGASAAMLNLTTVRPTGKGFATLYPCGDVPNASSLNFVAGSNVANATFVQLSDEGTVCVFTSRETHLVLDVVGYTAPV